jgi:hypothetical protein
LSVCLSVCQSVSEESINSRQDFEKTLFMLFSRGESDLIIILNHLTNVKYKSGLYTLDRDIRGKVSVVHHGRITRVSQSKVMDYKQADRREQGLKGMHME